MILRRGPKRTECTRATCHAADSVADASARVGSPALPALHQLRLPLARARLAVSLLGAERAGEFRFLVYYEGTSWRKNGTSTTRSAGMDHLVPTSLPFLGRSQEIEEISALLSDPACRLVTLVGPGGVGKTRLAVEVASGQAAAFADGVAFVALGAVDTPSQIVSAIGETLGLSFAGQPDPTAHLLSALRERH